MTGRLPLDLETLKTPRGAVYIIPSRCKGCRFCIEFCPQDVLIETKAINAKGYRYPVVAKGKESACIHCDFCGMVCPEMAIYTEEVKKNG